MRRPVALGLLALLALSAPAAAQDGAVSIAQFRQRDLEVENRLLREFEAATGIRVRQRVMPASSDLQHQQYVTWLASRDRSVDVYPIDLIWVAEFAAAGWILPLDERLPAGARGDFLPAPLASAVYRGRLYAVPRFTESGLLYYRTDLSPRPPATWQELAQRARGRADGDPWGS
jgi:multiple sugar transport system substrate-binding protein